MSNGMLIFEDIQPIEIPVKVKDKDYVLCEATGDDAAKWKNRLMRSMKMGSDGKPTIGDGIADNEVYLISLCLFEIREEGKRLPVPEAVLKTWPSKICKRLFEKVKEISELDDKEDPKTLEEKIEELRGKLAKSKEDSAKN